METQKTFEIPARNLETLTDKLERLNRKAAKLGMEPITAKVIGHEYVKRQVSIGEDEAGFTVFRTYTELTYQVEIEGVAPKLPGGWVFIGTVQHTEHGNILRTVPGQEMPQTYRTAKAVCDHCRLDRARKDTYVVRDEAGAYRQVGHSCIADYLGHQSPEHIARLAELIREIEESMGGSGSGQPSWVPTNAFLETAAAVVLSKGYVSKAAARAYEEKSNGMGMLTPTADHTWLQLFPPRPIPKDWETIPVTEESIALGKAVHEWAKALEGQSEYEGNLRIAALNERVTRREAGIVASAIGAYQKHLGKLAEIQKRRAERKPSEWFGTAGKREIFNLTVIGENVFPNPYGVQSQDRALVRMQDSEGNMAVWWTTVGHGLEIGKTYCIKGTVKKHDIYKGRDGLDELKQTVLTRCSDEEVAERLRAEAKVQKAVDKAKIKELKKARQEHDWMAWRTYFGVHYRCKRCGTAEAEPQKPCTKPMEGTDAKESDQNC